MTLSEKLKNARSQAGLSQKELAEKLDMNLRTYGSYERGERDLSTAILLKICKALNVSSDYLLGREPPKNEVVTISNDFDLSNSEHSHIKKYRTLDEYGKQAVDSILDIEYERCTYIEEPEDDEEDINPTFEIAFSGLPVSAGTGEFLSDEMTSMIEIPDTPFNRTADYVVQVNGDSMEPEFCDDDYLLVRKQPSVYEGEIGIFVIDGEGFVKRYGGDRLISINPRYKDIIFHEGNDVRCYGKVIGKL